MSKIIFGWFVSLFKVRIKKPVDVKMVPYRQLADLPIETKGKSDESFN